MKPPGSNAQALPPLLTGGQLFAFIVQTIIGVGVLSLPREVATATRTDGYTALLLCGLVNWGPLYLWLSLYRRFPHQSFYNVVVQSVSFRRPLFLRTFTLAVYLPLAALLVVRTGIETRLFADVVNAALLPSTPMPVVALLILIPSALFSLMAVDAQGRVNALLLPMLVVNFLVGVFLSMSRGDVYNLLPLFPYDWDDLGKGVLAALFAFQGAIVLSAYGGYVEQPRKILGLSIGAMALPAILYVLITTVAIAAFGHEELSRITWPTLELVRITTIPGLVLERLESVFLAAWLALVFLVTANYFGAYVQLAAWFAPGALGRHAVAAATVLILATAVALYPQTPAEVVAWSRWSAYATFCLTLAYPAMLHVLATIVQRGRRDENLRQPTS
ncbi:MAG TPA: GerAB/ArcD/ProY family transporter [Calditerricola sp.]